MAKKLWASGVYGKQGDFVVWHDHSREDLAVQAAVRTAKYKLRYYITHSLEQAVGVRDPNGQVRWYDCEGNEVTPQEQNKKKASKTARDRAIEELKKAERLQNGWGPYRPELCDICFRPARWKHPRGGFRCTTCPCPGE